LQRHFDLSKVVEMVEKNYVLRPALCALAIGAAFVLASNPALAGAHRGAVAFATATGATVPAAEAATAGAGQTWDFDHDRAQQSPQDWITIGGDWRVLVDHDAPSDPNVLGLPGYGLPHVQQLGLWFESFISTNYQLAIPKNAPQYSDFAYEAKLKLWGGAFGSYAGLVFRYSDPQNYYVLAAACPKDYIALYRMSGGQMTLIKQAPAELVRPRWYSLKVDAKGGHFVAYLDGKQVLAADDGSFTQGRIGVWSQNDSRASFDNIKLSPSTP